VTNMNRHIPMAQTSASLKWIRCFSLST